MKVKLWAVAPKKKTIDESLCYIQAIVKNVKQANDYILNLLHMEHINHFEQWCELHDRDSNIKDTFYDYLDIMYPDYNPFSEYVIIPLYYTKDNLCILIRSLMGYIPVGANYETQEEVEIFLDRQKSEGNIDGSKC